MYIRTHYSNWGSIHETGIGLIFFLMKISIGSDTLKEAVKSAYIFFCCLHWRVKCVWHVSVMALRKLVSKRHKGKQEPSRSLVRNSFREKANMATAFATTSKQATAEHKQTNKPARRRSTATAAASRPPKICSFSFSCYTPLCQLSKTRYLPRIRDTPDAFSCLVSLDFSPFMAVGFWPFVFYTHSLFPLVFAPIFNIRSLRTDFKMATKGWLLLSFSFYF